MKIKESKKGNKREATRWGRKEEKEQKGTKGQLDTKNKQEQKM